MYDILDWHANVVLTPCVIIERGIEKKNRTYRTGEGEGEVGVGDTKRIGAAAGRFYARTT